MRTTKKSAPKARRATTPPAEYGVRRGNYNDYYLMRKTPRGWRQVTNFCPTLWESTTGIKLPPVITNFGLVAPSELPPITPINLNITLKKGKKG